MNIYRDGVKEAHVPMMRRLLPWPHLFESPLTIGAVRLLGRAAEFQVPEPILRLFIRAFTAWFGVDMSEVLVPSGGFGCFADFFARPLRLDARPICSDPDTVVSPCDAVVLDKGTIDDDAMTCLVAIKGSKYNIRDLIGDAAVAVGLSGGGYCVLYLHPRDYHRVHAPLDGTLGEVRHIPGARYPMAPWASRLTDGVFEKNERMAFDIELPQDRKCVLLMVAAFGVGGIETPHMSGTTSPRADVCRVPANNRVIRGDELGAFRIGSTVVLLWPPGTIELDPGLGVDRSVVVGQPIGRLYGTNW